mmetsp:Transcript_45382/g.84655  ORF Transcript_45382/g.84655 Transcript_45382/m.84655 type:complete len:206 (-) Transcript_45382:364-981(-)
MVRGGGIGIGRAPVTSIQITPEDPVVEARRQARLYKAVGLNQPAVGAGGVADQMAGAWLHVRRPPFDHPGEGIRPIDASIFRLGPAAENAHNAWGHQGPGGRIGTEVLKLRLVKHPLQVDMAGMFGRCRLCVCEAGAIILRQTYNGPSLFLVEVSDPNIATGVDIDWPSMQDARQRIGSIHKVIVPACSPADQSNRPVGRHGDHL